MKPWAAAAAPPPGPERDAASAGADRGRTVAALAGLALSGMVAAWWLGGSRLAIDQGSDASRVSGQALQALWLARGTLIALWSVRLGALHGWPAAAQAGALLSAPAWPIVALSWSASTVPGWPVWHGELLLLIGAAALSALGSGLRHLLPGARATEIAATTAGAALAGTLWWAGGMAYAV